MTHGRTGVCQKIFLQSHRTVIVRMQHHDATRAYVARRTADGRTNPEIIRCLKRYVAREVWALLKPLRSPPAETVS